jgi:hypothetical protein
VLWIEWFCVIWFVVVLKRKAGYPPSPYVFGVWGALGGFWVVALGGVGGGQFLFFMLSTCVVYAVEKFGVGFGNGFGVGLGGIMVGSLGGRATPGMLGFAF